MRKAITLLNAFGVGLFLPSNQHVPNNVHSDRQYSSVFFSQFLACRVLGSDFLKEKQATRYTIIALKPCVVLPPFHKLACVSV